MQVTMLAHAGAEGFRFKGSGHSETTILAKFVIEIDAPSTTFLEFQRPVLPPPPLVIQVAPGIKIDLRYITPGLIYVF